MNISSSKKTQAANFWQWNTIAIKFRLRNPPSHLHEQEPYDEGRPLAVADLPVVDGVGLHHVEQRLLADAVLLLEEVVLGIGAGNVPGN